VKQQRKLSREKIYPSSTPQSTSVISAACTDWLMHHSPDTHVNCLLKAWGRMQCTVRMPEIGWWKHPFAMWLAGSNGIMHHQIKFLSFASILRISVHVNNPHACQKIIHWHAHHTKLTHILTAKKQFDNKWFFCQFVCTEGPVSQIFVMFSQRVFTVSNLATTS